MQHRRLTAAPAAVTLMGTAAITVFNAQPFRALMKREQATPTVTADGASPLRLGEDLIRATAWTPPEPGSRRGGRYPANSAFPSLQKPMSSAAGLSAAGPATSP